MRLRLVHTLSLWLLAAVGASVLAMGGVTAWNLGQGFGAYLVARDTERLDDFVALMADALLADGGAPALQERRLDVPALLRELARREGILAPVGRREASIDGPPERPPGPPRDGPPDRQIGGPPRDRHPGGRPHPPEVPDGRGRAPGPSDSFGSRLGIFGLDGRQLMGPAFPAGTADFVERPVRLQGEPVGLVRLRPLKRAPDPNEVRFLRSQYLGIAAVAGVLMLLALAAAWRLSLLWARPLAAVQEATARIARGELGVRLPPARNDEIGDVVRNVNQMAEGLQRLEGARRRWIADMSHELRTPLTGLRGEIEALVDGVRPLTLGAARSLREEVLRLGTLVDDLHLLAMADLHSLPCRFVDADAVEIVQRTLVRFAPRAAAAGLSLAWATSPAPPPALPVVWDPGRIEQLLANLLENSLRYTDRPGCIEVGLRGQGGRVQLCIADSAPGVGSADLPHLFEPLYRADAARSRHTGGSGLGLAIAEAIVAAHGGHIRAQPSPLGGLQVTVDLPAAAQGGEAPSRLDRPRGDAGVRGTKVAS